MLWSGECLTQWRHTLIRSQQKQFLVEQHGVQTHILPGKVKMRFLCWFTVEFETIRQIRFRQNQFLHTIVQKSRARRQSVVLIWRRITTQTVCGHLVHGSHVVACLLSLVAYDAMHLTDLLSTHGHTHGHSTWYSKQPLPEVARWSFLPAKIFCPLKKLMLKLIPDSPLRMAPGETS